MQLKGVIKMGDYAILRINIENPDESELVKIIANVPLNWTKYLKQVAEETGINGRYVAATILYDNDYFLPESVRESYELVEKSSDVVGFQGDELT